MKQQFLAVVLLVGFSGMVSAAAPEEGWFAGVSYGATKIDDKAFRSATDLESFDNQDSSIQLWGGYRLADWVSLEGRYSTLGEYVSKVNDGTSEGKENKSDAEGLSVHMKLIWPFGNSGFDVYGQLGVGVANWDSDLTLSGLENSNPADLQADFSTSGTEPLISYGVGLRWTFISRLTVQLAVDAYQFKGAGVINYPGFCEVANVQTSCTLSEKINFDADILTTSLGLQYNF